MGCHLIVAIASGVLGMFQFGYNTGVINAPQGEIEAFLRQSFEGRYGYAIDEDKAKSYFSGAVSVGLIGGMMGALGGGWLADKSGRQRGLIYAQLPSIVGGVCQGLAKPASSYELLMVGRFLFGLACGLFTALSPLYLAEISPIRVRGAVGTLNQLAVTCGIFTSMVLGLSGVLGGPETWPILLGLNVVPALVQTALLLFVAPESPRYLILTKKKMVEGEAALKKLRGRDDVADDVAEIVAEENQEEAADSAMGILDLFKDKGLRLTLFVCVCMHLSQQLAGIVGIFYYSTDFFRGAGIDCNTSQYATLCVGAIMVTMTFVTIPLMDRLGRRFLHLAGLSGIILCSILIVIASSLVDGKRISCNDNVTGNATANDVTSPASTTAAVDGNGVFLIVSTLAFVVFFAIGPGSIPWMCAGELFPQSSRAAASSVAVFVNWLGNLTVGFLFPLLTLRLKQFSFLPFLVVTAVLFAILFVYLPETKNRSTVQIASLFKAPNAWRTPIGLKNNAIEMQQQQSQAKS